MTRPWRERNGGWWSVLAGLVTGTGIVLVAVIPLSWIPWTVLATGLGMAAVYPLGPLARKGWHG